MLHRKVDRMTGGSRLTPIFELIIVIVSVYEGMAIVSAIQRDDAARVMDELENRN